MTFTQTNINKEIRTYQEDVFMGLTLRQLLCSGVAIGAAVGAYFALRGLLGQETVSWVCIVCASPIAAAGFFEYDGLTFERFLKVVWETSFFRAGPRVWKAENRYQQEKENRAKKRGLSTTISHMMIRHTKKEDKSKNATS